MATDDLAKALRQAFVKTHKTEHAVFDDPDRPNYGQLNGWYDLDVIAKRVLLTWTGHGR